MTFRLHRWAAAALLALLWAAAAPAAPVGSGSGEPKKPETAAEKVRQALDEVTDVTIEKQPLELAIRQLGDQAKINFVIDTFQIQNLGIDLQGAEVNVKLQGVKLRSALRTLLNQHNLGYAVIGDTVLITTEEMAMHRQMRQRVSVDADNLPVAKALKQLARETGTNVLVDARVSKEAQAPVTLQVDDVPLDTAVKLLAHLSGLRTVRVGNVLFVTNKETAEEMRQDPDLTGPPATPGGPPRVEEVIRGLAIPAGGLPPGQPAPLLLPANPPPPPVVPPPEKEKKDEDKPKDAPKPDEKPR
jgi:hypothetical protein